MSNEKLAPGLRLPGRHPRLTALIVLSSFAAMGAVVLTPSLPTIARYFSIRQGAAQLVVTAFLVGYSVGQLLYGPIANTWGRRTGFYVGIAIATLGSIASILAHPIESFGLLIAGRCLEALGSSAGLVVSLTIVADFYRDTRARKVMSYVMLAFAIVPGVGILVGGILVELFDWQANFYFLLAYGLLLIWPASQLPETLLKRVPGAIRPGHVWRGFVQAFASPVLMSGAVFMGFSVACVYAFAVEGPIVGIRILGHSPASYGSFGLVPYAGALIGSLASAQLVERWSTKILLLLAFGCEIVGALFLLFGTLAVGASLWVLLASVGIFLLGHSIIVGNIAALVASDAPDRATFSSVLTFIGTGIAVIVSLIISFIPIISPLVLPITFVICLAVMGVLWILALRRYCT